MTRGLIRFLVVGATCLALPARGAILTESLLDPTPVPGAASLTFASHAVEEFTLGPVALTASDGTSVTYQATNPYGDAGFSAFTFGLGENGMWSTTYAAASPSPGFSYAFVSGDYQGGLLSTLRVTFSHPMSSVGGLLNYAFPNPFDPFYDPRVFAIRAIGGDGSILEQYVLEDAAPIRTPGATNAGAFRGISRSQADIYAFEIRGSGVIHDLEFVPEPGLGSLGLVGLVLAASRRVWSP
jgi:hypothetical protein